MAYRRSSQQLSQRRRPQRGRSYHSSKLQRHRQTSSIDLLQQSFPSEKRETRLANRFYVEGIALSAHRVGSLAVVLREGQGYQLYSWELRSPISSLLFETFGYCYEAAVELGQRFDVENLLRLQPFGAAEKVDGMIKAHQMREQVAMGQD